MNNKRNLAIAVVVATAAGIFAVQNALAPASNNIGTTTATDAFDPESTTFTPIYEGCAFIWASHDAPELTERLDAAVRALDPQASATASLYGEDCVYADGHATFSTMETDFYVELTVEELTDHAAFGDWIKQVLDVILQIPRDEMKGNDGFVDFWFVKNETDEMKVTVPIQRYRSEAQGKTGEELFLIFYQPG